MVIKKRSEIVRVRRAAEKAGGNYKCQGRDHQCHDGPGEQSGLLDTEIVDEAQSDNGSDGKRSREVGVKVIAEGESHRSAARKFSDDEGPTGKVAPEMSQTLATVDIGTA